MKYKDRKRASEILFWFHLLSIFTVIFLGFFISLQIVIFVLFIHRAHVLTFKECLLSKAQKKLDKSITHLNFLQLTTKRIFSKKITPIQSNYIDYAIVFISISIAAIISSV